MKKLAKKPISKLLRPKKPSRLTEDEADAIISHRRLKQRRYGLHEVMRQAGYAVDRRVGRIVYFVYHSARRVVITRVRHRKEAYRGL